MYDVNSDGVKEEGLFFKSVVIVWYFLARLIYSAFGSLVGGGVSLPLLLMSEGEGAALAVLLFDW